MSKVKDNYVVQGMSGKIGKNLVFKTNKFGHTYTSLPPNRTNVISTKAQKKSRNNFAKAVAFGKSVLKDPSLAVKYKSRDKISLYNAAVQDFLNQHKVSLKKTTPVLINDKYILKHCLSNRQVKGLQFILKRGRIYNSDFQRINHVSKPTATRDLQDLVKKKILNPSGIRGAGAYYELMDSDT